MSAPVRILIADDHMLVRKGLRSVLESQPGWVVCGEATNGREAVDMAQQLKPHVVVMDIGMPELNGLDATRRIRRGVPGCEVLILTMHHSEQLIHEVLAAGAKAFILKSDAGQSIVEAVECLRRHKPFFTAYVSELLLTSYLDSDKSGAARGDSAGALTSREREIVQSIAKGKSSKEIAAALEISDSTAETHRTNIMRKLGVHSISEIVRYAIRNRIIEP